MEYEVNKDTYAIFPINGTMSKVYEGNDEYVISSTPYSIMEHSCEYFGSSINGRLNGAKNILGTIYKAPIVVEEYHNLVFFPTKSIYLEDQNIWISLNNITKYESDDKKNTIIFFKNGKKLSVNIPFLSFENQLLRATRLESVLRQRHFN